MNYELGTDGERRLGAYFDMIGDLLGHKLRRASFAAYAMGLLGEGDRKSMEPIAARMLGDPMHAGAGHQRLQHFIADSEWNDVDVRRAAARYAIEELEKQEVIRTWIIDDTGFLKQGKHSVGVQRQYTGSAGKTANCQIGVSLSVATSTQHLPIDFELFLPESWANDAERRKKAKVPEDVTFRTKHELALAMIERAARDGIPGDILLADSFYGHARPFRDAVRLMGFDYGVAIYGSDTMHVLDARGNRSPLRSAKEIALGLSAGDFRMYSWREGTNGRLRSRFAFRRVQMADEDGLASLPEWLMIEWPEHEKEPTKFLLTTLRKAMPKKMIVRLVMERYRTERVYEEMKGELGLDHFEGRSYRGWHHHVSVALCCYAFVIAERARHFPPSEGRQDPARPLERAA